MCMAFTCDMLSGGRTRLHVAGQPPGGRCIIVLALWTAAEAASLRSLVVFCAVCRVSRAVCSRRDAVLVDRQRVAALQLRIALQQLLLWCVVTYIRKAASPQRPDLLLGYNDRPEGNLAFCGWRSATTIASCNAPTKEMTLCRIRPRSSKPTL